MGWGLDFFSPKYSNPPLPDTPTPSLPGTPTYNVTLKKKKITPSLMQPLKVLVFIFIFRSLPYTCYLTNSPSQPLTQYPQRQPMIQHPMMMQQPMPGSTSLCSLRSTVTLFFLISAPTLFLPLPFLTPSLVIQALPNSMPKRDSTWITKAVLHGWWCNNRWAIFSVINRSQINGHPQTGAVAPYGWLLAALAPCRHSLCGISR